MDKKEYCKVTVHWDNKSTGKLDTRILILRSDRLDVAVLKGQIKVERTVHYLDIRRLEAGENNGASLTLVTNECLQFSCTLEADLTRIVSHLVASLQFHLPQLRTSKQQLMELIVPPAWKLDSMISEHLAELGRPAATTDKCGHFGTAYEFFCRYTGAEVREEIKWDVETIYFSQGSRAFAMADFGHFEQGDFAVILAALSFNDYFTVLNANGVKFFPQMIKFLEMMLTYNSTLVELQLSNCGLKMDSVRAIAAAIDSNSKCRIKVLDLSNNLFTEDKAVDRLCALLTRLSGSLERLNLSKCGLSSKALNKLCDALSSQNQGPPPLSQLIIDGNEQRGENSARASLVLLMKQPRNYELVQKCIAKATNMEHLSCVGCDFNLDSFAPAFLRGLTQCVTYLDLSGNQFGNLRRGSRPKDQTLLNKDWGQLFARCLRLRVLRLNNCRMPPQAVSDLLSGLGSNQDLKGVTLELAGNDLGVAGAQVLCSCFNSCSIKCIESLDISDNVLDSELNRVVEAVCRSSIRHLSIGGSNFRAKDMSIVEEFSELVTDSKSTLVSLSVRDARLRERLAVLLNAVGQCCNLTRLDITGNGMQGLGAKFLAKSLYLNSSLVEVQLDDNQIGLSGLRDITEALQFNSSLRSMPVPAGDVARMLTESPPAAVHEVLAALQQGLLKNHSATYQVTGRDYRLQSELGSYAFSLDHLAGRLEHGLKAIGPCDGDPEAAECERLCRAAMRDALSARYLLGGLSDVAGARPADTIKRCLSEALPQQLLTSANADLAGTQQAMLQFLATECPNAFKVDPGLAQVLRDRLVTDQSQFSASSVFALLEKSAGASIASKLSSLQLNSALLINDCMQEAIGHNLQQAEQALNKLMRSKMLQPNLRRSESRKPSIGDPQTPPPQTPPQTKKKRPISVFGKKGRRDVIEISLDCSDSGDDTADPASGTSVPQPVTRRPLGDPSRRPPTQSPPPAAATTADDVEEEEEENVYEASDEEPKAESVTDKRNEDQAARSVLRLTGAVKLPAGAVPVMCMGPPPPAAAATAVRTEEASAGSPGASARVVRPPGGLAVMMAVSRDDLARTLLRRADATEASPAATAGQPPAPKQKPKSAVRTPSKADSAKPPDRSNSTVDGSPNGSDAAAKPSDQKPVTLLIAKSLPNA